MSRWWGRIMLLLLAVATGVSIWRTTVTEREKRQVAAAYQQAQQLVEQLHTERSHLNDELLNAREKVEVQAGDLSNLQEELKTVQGRLDQTLAQVSVLQQAHAQLQEQNGSLEEQLSSAITEKQQIEAKLSDLRELKLAIRDVRHKIWNRRLAALRTRLESLQDPVRIEALREADQEQLASGNRGYVVREGASTLGSGPRLHVHVLEPQSQ